jgi:hypothetical protein
MNTSQICATGKVGIACRLEFSNNNILKQNALVKQKLAHGNPEHAFT